MNLCIWLKSSSLGHLLSKPICSLQLIRQMRVLLIDRYEQCQIPVWLERNLYHLNELVIKHFGLLLLLDKDYRQDIALLILVIDQNRKEWGISDPQLFNPLLRLHYFLQMEDKHRTFLRIEQMEKVVMRFALLRDVKFIRIERDEVHLERRKFAIFFLPDLAMLMLLLK